MDGITLKQIREILLDRRRQIDTAKHRESDAATDLAGAQAEMIDMAQALEQIDREQSLGELERKELVAVERAIAKLSGGNFGVCEDCDEAIPAKRLMVLPEARLCARCQEYEERVQSRHRGVSAAAR